MPTRPNNKRRLRKGKDYDGWRVIYPDGEVSRKVWETKEEAQVWYPRGWLVKVKIVTVG